MNPKRLTRASRIAATHSIRQTRFAEVSVSSMDDEIHFGELEESAPQRQLRPDQNRHYAVVAYATPSGNDLPIYVDMDVVREMEAHALSNTNVELGGVLLGGHYEDEDGKPFVVITDSLRAEHYEATKGSFKFTHETWSDITRRSGTSSPKVLRWLAGTTRTRVGECSCPAWTRSSVIISSTNRSTWHWSSTRANPSELSFSGRPMATCDRHAPPVAFT